VPSASRSITKRDSESSNSKVSLPTGISSKAMPPLRCDVSLPFFMRRVR